MGDCIVFDLNAALKRVGNDRECFAHMTEFFFEDYPAIVDRLHQALDNRNAQGVGYAAHSLKGLVANFDANDLVHLAALIEKAASDGDLKAARTSSDALETGISRLHEALVSYRSVDAPQHAMAVGRQS
jgi:HPt (histidine-containing phosphotransfer) domain-containing protein